jgi:hypothetical protein
MTEKSHAGFGRESLAAGKYLQTDNITIKFDYLGLGGFTIDIFDDGQVTERGTSPPLLLGSYRRQSPKLVCDGLTLGT